jgi:hypothetical protein
MIETVSFQRRENWDELTKQEKLALQDIYPASKYTKIPDIDMEDWKRMKYDYKDKFTYYKYLVPQVCGSALFVLSGDDGPKLKKYEPVIDDPIITKKFPGFYPSSRQSLVDMPMKRRSYLTSTSKPKGTIQISKFLKSCL